MDLQIQYFLYFVRFFKFFVGAKTMAESEPEKEEEITTMTNEDNSKIAQEISDELYTLKSQIKNDAKKEDLLFEETIQNQAKKENINIPCMTSKKELIGWYLVDMANSPMWNVVIGFVWPLLVTNAATSYACNNNTINGCDWHWDPILPTKSLKVMSYTPVSFTFFIQSLSGALQAFSYVFFGGLADYNDYQYKLFKYTTVIAGMYVHISGIIVSYHKSVYRR